MQFIVGTSTPVGTSTVWTYEFSLASSSAPVIGNSFYEIVLLMVIAGILLVDLFRRLFVK